MKKILVYGLFGLMIMAMVTLIAQNNRTSNEKSKIEFEKEYYKNLERFKNNDKENAEKYINTYTKYFGNVLPNEEIEFLKNMTNKSYHKELNISFENGSAFLSDEDYKKLQEESADYLGAEAQMYSNPVDEAQAQVQEIKVLYKLLEISYSYMDNTYIAKIEMPTGKAKMTCFKFEKGKVIKIYDL